jgi:hypothetical protein
MLIFSISFSDFIKFPYFMDTPERRVWGARRPKYRVIFQIILVFTLTEGHVSVFDKYLQWSCVSVKNYIYTATG